MRKSHGARNRRTTSGGRFARLVRSLSRRKRGGRSDDLGRRGEKAAARHLVRNGYRIVDTNYHTRFGELDIVAMHGDVLVFVEVKTLSGDDAADPASAVDNRKRKCLVRTARHWAHAKGMLDSPMRFDVAAVIFDRNARDPFVRVITDAFPGDG